MLPRQQAGLGSKTFRAVRRQVRKLFTANMTALGIPTVAAPGESFHIDWINATDDREALIEVARKSYLDWYMLTQARIWHTKEGLHGAVCH